MLHKRVTISTGYTLRQMNRVPKAFRNERLFGTIKAQTLSNQVELVLVFIIMRWSRSDGAPFGILHPNRKVSAVHLVIMIRLSRLEMQRIFRVTNQNES